MLKYFFNFTNIKHLSISKSITPSQVVDNDRVTYTFVIQNTGNEAVDATDNTVINDLFKMPWRGLFLKTSNEFYNAKETI